VPGKANSAKFEKSGTLRFWTPMLLKTAAFFLKIEIDNPPSNFASDKMQLISNKQQLKMGDSYVFRVCEHHTKP
jgi:hypothetical protein